MPLREISVLAALARECVRRLLAGEGMGNERVSSPPKQRSKGLALQESIVRPLYGSSIQVLQRSSGGLLLSDRSSPRSCRKQ